MLSSDRRERPYCTNTQRFALFRKGHRISRGLVRHHKVDAGVELVILEWLAAGRAEMLLTAVRGDDLGDDLNEAKPIVQTIVYPRPLMEPRGDGGRLSPQDVQAYQRNAQTS
jgi:hypothetical protein